MKTATKQEMFKTLNEEMKKLDKADVITIFCLAASSLKRRGYDIEKWAPTLIENFDSFDL